MPAANSAAATVSPARALMLLPSTVMATGALRSTSLLNMEPPRTERSDQRSIEGTARDHRRDGARVVGREGHAGTAAHGEGAGMSRRVPVHLQRVRRRDAQ